MPTMETIKLDSLYCQIQITATGQKRKCRECSRIRKNKFGKKRMPEGIRYSSTKVEKS